jgi:tripartite-type tricarboxylate transporter receptor subunit TctC
MRVLMTGLLWAASVATSFAQGYPTKPIRFIVPYPPGGGTDLISRTLGVKVSEILGQPVIIENRPGGQGNIGTNAIAKAAPDGYTIGLSYAGTFAINPWLYKDLGYDPLKDFSHVSLVTVQPYVIAINPALPVKNLKELAQFANSRPNGVTFATSAAAGQVAGELFKLLSNAKMFHIPYKGAGPALTDVIGGHTDLLVATPAGSIPHVKEGKLRALAVTGPTRLAALPNVPTSRESGFPEFEISGWYGVIAPANTPRDIVMKLNSAYTTALKMKEVRESLISDGLETKSSSPDEQTEFVKSEYVRWGKVVKASNMQAE